MKRSDLIVGAVVAAVGAYALFGALRLAFFFNRAPGPGFFPVFLSALLLALGLLLAATSLPGRSQAARADGPRQFLRPASAAVERPGPEEAAEGTTGRPELLRVAGVAGGWIVSVVFIGLLGFVPTMMLLVLYLSMVIEGRRGWRPVVAAIVIPVAAYLAFGRFLQVQLPVGPLGY